jgi:hypothetical protein
LNRPEAGLKLAKPTAAMVGFVMFARMVSIACTVLAAALAPGFVVSALAQQRTTPSPIPCTCRMQGTDVPVGATVCLQTPSGGRLATCSLAQNVTSWDITADPCTISRAPTNLHAAAR